jgi:hypothetical protein
MGRYDLNPLKKSPSNYNIVAFDVEGSGINDGFILGVIYDCNGSRVYHNPDRMKRDLLSYKYRGAKIFAHNLEYDWGCLWQNDSKGWNLYRLSSRLIKAVYRDNDKHVWHFWDSTNHSAFQSVDALGRILDIPKLPTPEYIKLDGTSSLKRSKLTKSQLSEIADYCIRDTRIVYEYMVMFQDTINSLGGQMSTTLASTAMDLFRRSFMDRPIHTPHPNHNDTFRQAYYGGRTEAFKYGFGQSLYQYDVHSLYPFIMSNIDLPDTATGYFINTTPKVDNIFQYEGMTSCVVTAPKLHIPILPTRIQGRLLFVSGTFEGTWCHNELRIAIEHGYNIDSINWQYIATHSIRPLSGYVNQLYALKQLAQTEGNPIYFVYKILMNSLYGKFGQRSDGAYTKLVNIADVPDFLSMTDIDVHFWQGEGYVSFDAAGQNQPAYVIVIFAAYITAGARIAEYKLLSQYGDSVCYGDTDCAIGPTPLQTGVNLGELGLERGPVDFFIRGEKYYSWLENGTKPRYKKAGIPHHKQGEFWDNGRISYPRPSKLGESLRDNKPMSVWFNQTKTDRPRYFKRKLVSSKWFEDRLMETTPWTNEEAQEHYTDAPNFLPWRRQNTTPERIVAESELKHIDDWKTSQVG